MEYIEQVKKVLDKIRKAGFYINLEKSKFHVQEVTLEQEIYELRENNKELDLSYIPKEYKGYLNLFRKIEKDNIALLLH